MGAPIRCLVFAVAAIATAGCNKITGNGELSNSPLAIEPKCRADVMQQPADAERRVELPAPHGMSFDDAIGDHQVDVAEAIAHERSQVRRVLTREIRWIDKQVATLKSEADSARGAQRDERLRDVDMAREWQTRLKQDLEAIDRVSDKVWPALRDHIDRDLEEEHPASIPRSFDKAYEI